MLFLVLKSVLNIKSLLWYMDWNRLVFHLKYPHLLVLLALAIISYFVFSNSGIINAITGIGDAAYMGSFFSGMLFSMAITAPVGAGFWSVAVPKNIFVAALFGGMGTAIVDVLVFRSVKAVIHVRTEVAKKSKYMPHMEKVLANNFARVVVASLSFDLTGFLIGLPLPHNFEKVLVSSVSRLKEWEVGVMSFIVFTIVALFFLSLKITVPLVASLLGLA